MKEKSWEYLDLSNPEVYAKLTPMEKYYIKRQQEIYGEKVIIPKKDYYDTLDTSFEREGAIARQRAILSGELYEQSQDIFYENYAQGLRNRGQTELANLVELIMKKNPGYRTKDALYRDLPMLDVFYADKRSNYGKGDVDMRTLGDTEETYSEVETVLVEYAEKQGLPKYMINATLKGAFTDLTHNDIKEMSDTELKATARSYIDI